MNGLLRGLCFQCTYAVAAEWMRYGGDGAALHGGLALRKALIGCGMLGRKSCAD
jgi:hypothetical protein